MRFKELRGLFLGVMLVILDIGLFVYAMSSHDKVKMIAALALTVVIFISLLSQFYVRVLSDCIFLYHFAGIALLPKLVDFKDIIAIKKPGKHHLIIETEHDCNHIYVWNAEKLLKELNKNKEQPENEKN